MNTCWLPTGGFRRCAWRSIPSVKLNADSAMRIFTHGATPRLATVLDQQMANLNPLKYCFHGQHSRPRATFSTLPGVKNKREVCAEGFEKIMADRKQKKQLRRSPDWCPEPDSNRHDRLRSRDFKS